ncbi:MAG: hypothetical protein KDD70_14070 [Bdellovibrionales bacterium]|nr:hypothetical protein [Bdellovibrionales bacterium]
MNEPPPVTVWSNIKVAMQLLAIFTLVRIVMMKTGIMFIRIPIFDSLLAGSMNAIVYQLQNWGLIGWN